MPPKKARNPEDDSIISSSGVDDYLLPRTVVQRLAKGVLPPNTIMQKDALTAIMKSTTVFVNYLASNANDRAVLGNHKTIKPEDVLLALEEMEFGQFVPRVRQEHDVFVQTANDKRNDYRRKLKDDKDATAKPAGEPGDVTTAGGVDQVGDDTTISDRSMNAAEGGHATEDGQPAAKRPRMSDGGDVSMGDGMDMDQDRDATEDEEDLEDPGDPLDDISESDPDDEEAIAEREEVRREEEEEEALDSTIAEREEAKRNGLLPDGSSDDDDDF